MSVCAHGTSSILDLPRELGVSTVSGDEEQGAQLILWSGLEVGHLASAPIPWTRNRTHGPNLRVRKMGQHNRPVCPGRGR